MSVSGTTALTMTARDMITNAMIELGVLSSGEEPTADELADGLVRLNSQLKSWQLQGVNLWREDDRSITITANTATVTLPTDVRQVFSARFIGDYERLLHRWEREDYFSLPVKTSSGDPTIFYVSRDRDGLTAYFWPVPTADSTVKIECERIVDTVTDATQDVDVPQHAFEACWTALAVRLIPMFNASGTAISPVTASMVTQRAEMLFSALQDDDRPESVFIGAWT